MVRESTQTLAGKVAAVSGASSGIGAIIARELAHRGATIIINYPQPGEQKAAETSIPTVRKSVTGTSTKIATATTTNSVIQTVLVDATTTQVNDRTKIITQQTTMTFTTTAQNGSPPFKRAANNVPAIPSYATKGCTNSAKYSSACSRVGVTSKAITLPRATIVSVIHRVVIPRRSTIKTTVETAYATKTVKTETVLQTYTTERITRIIKTATEDNFIATQTIYQTSTTTKEVDSVQTVYLVAHDSGDPNLAPFGGIGFVDLESQQGSSANYFVDFTANFGPTQQFTLNLHTGELVADNGPGSSAGETAYYGTGSSSSQYGNVRVLSSASVNSASPLVCKIVPATSYQFGLQCLWGSNQIAEFWTCASQLVLVQPGYDFTSQCPQDSTSYSISIEVRQA
ncbi:uncharacterized protein QYS62_010751 [Fusarium acuminatum]|uniref:Uncharacterized protein n=1 Tax=Fusarium acuminatum TaxID=5515 RepID=A0ABZ2X9V4_9HYPO